MNIHKRRAHAGFTLVETVIAMGIITIMITAFMAAFGPAVKGISRSVSAKEANRLASTLEYELSVLRPDEAKPAGPYTTAFEKAFTWIEGSGGTTKNGMILMYQYRGDPSTPNTDGTLEPYTGTDGVPGKDYVLESVVRQYTNAAVATELKPGIVEGRVFLVRMSQLVFNNTSGALELTGDPTAIQDPQNPAGGLTYALYPEATIAFQASFYVLKSNSYSYISGALDLTKDDNDDGYPDDTGKPIFTRNMAVRR